jgi:lipopolysaccharide export system permease protein
MQFVWTYIDELVGKGLEFTIIAELLLYTSTTLVPMALPLAILLSSIMTFGNLGERYELVSMKSSGISLLRIMMPLIAFTFALSVGAFFFSNNVLPVANLKMWTLMHDIKHKRPTLEVKEGVFYDGIDNFVIKVKSKDSKRNMMYDIMIYDHRDKKGNMFVSLADSGQMWMTKDEKFVVFELYNGYSYEEAKEETKNKAERKYPQNRQRFEKQIVTIPLGEMDLERTDESLFKNSYKMLNIDQLDKAIDSLNESYSTRKDIFTAGLIKTNYFKKERKNRSKENEKSRMLSNTLPLSENISGLQKRTLNLNNETIHEVVIKTELAKKEKVLITVADSADVSYSENFIEFELHGSSSTLVSKHDSKKLNKKYHSNRSKNSGTTILVPFIEDSSFLFQDTISPEDLAGLEDSIINNKLAESPLIVSSFIKPMVFRKTIMKDNKPIPNMVFNFDTLLNSLSSDNQRRAFDIATNYARSAKAYTTGIVKEFENREKIIRRHEIAYHKKFTLSFACLVLFFIGAPFGAIIRKGGLGLPVVISVILFIMFYIIDLMGENFVKEGVMEVYQGMWFSSAVLLPVGLFLTYKAANDSALFDMDLYVNFFNKIFKNRSSTKFEKHIEKDENIDYADYYEMTNNIKKLVSGISRFREKRIRLSFVNIMLPFTFRIHKPYKEVYSYYTFFINSMIELGKEHNYYKTKLNQVPKLKKNFKAFIIFQYILFPLFPITNLIFYFRLRKKLNNLGHLISELRKVINNPDILSIKNG